jgi:hypothetical protein
MVWWNAVSNTAIFGTPGNISSIASIHIKLAGLCNGAKSLKSNILCLTSGVISTEFLKSSHPCTTLCPTALISSIDQITHFSLSIKSSKTKLSASL